MSNKVYMARKGATFSDKKAQMYGEHIERLTEKYDGKITPSNIVDDAKGEQSPIHPYFEWNDMIAGEKYRLWQARQLVGHLIIRVEEKDGVTVRGWLSIKEYDENVLDQCYVAIDNIRSNEEYRLQTIRNAIKEVKNWYGRYVIYSELEPVFSAIKKVELKMLKVKGQ